MPAADCRRVRENRQSPFGKLRRRRTTAEIQGNDGAAERNGRSLIRRVFFNRLGAANLLSWFAGAALIRSRAFVNFLEDVRDHRGCGRAAMNFAANVAFVNGGESVP